MTAHRDNQRCRCDLCTLDRLLQRAHHYLNTHGHPRHHEPTTCGTCYNQQDAA